jgi:hypothetical protein
LTVGGNSLFNWFIKTEGGDSGIITLSINYSLECYSNITIYENVVIQFLSWGEFISGGIFSVYNEMYLTGSLRGRSTATIRIYNLLVLAPLSNVDFPCRFENYGTVIVTDSVFSVSGSSYNYGNYIAEKTVSCHRFV